MQNVSGAVDAYEHFGPLCEGHPAIEAGLRSDSSDERLETVKENFLDLEGLVDESELRTSDGVPITDLGSALVSWRDDLLVVEETEADALDLEVYV